MAAGLYELQYWWSLEDAKVRLPEEDLRALHQLRRGKAGHGVEKKTS